MAINKNQATVYNLSHFGDWLPDDDASGENLAEG